MTKYVTEFIGTFILVLTIGVCSLGTGRPGTLAPIAIGLVLMVMVYAGGHLSGAHYNPAVSVAALVRGRIKFPGALIYVVVQFAAAILAAWTAIYLKAPADRQLTVNLSTALVAEGIFTFILAYVILNVATAKGTAGNSFYGVAIGGTVAASALAIGSISGCALNPAVTVGLLVMGILPSTLILPYIAVQVVAGALAGAYFKLANRDDA